MINKGNLQRFHMNISSRKSNYSYSSEDDLTVNREAKKFMKDQFTSWYSAQIQSQLDSGVVLDDVDVDLRLSVLKPIHKLGSLACTTIYLALKADSQLQKDGRRQA